MKNIERTNYYIMCKKWVFPEKCFNMANKINGEIYKQNNLNRNSDYKNIYLVINRKFLTRPSLTILWTINMKTNGKWNLWKLLVQT